MAEQVVRLLEDHSKSGVYQILNTVNGKRYVGSAVNFQKRWKQHRTHLTQGKHHSIVLQRAWDKHGESAFAFSVIEYTSRRDAVVVEQKYIDAHQSANHRFGYNIAPTAGSCLGVKHSDEVCRRRSVISRGKKRTDETKKLMSDVLRKRMSTPEARARASENAKKQFGTPEARRILSERQTGKKASAATRQKISESKRGLKQSAETRAKKSEAHKRKPDETAERMRVARQVRWADPEQRKRQSQMKKEQWAARRAKQSQKQLFLF